MKHLIASKWSAHPRNLSFRDRSRFSPPPADHGPGRLSSIQPCAEELFGAGIMLDICTPGISFSFQLLDGCSEVPLCCTKSSSG